MATLVGNRAELGETSRGLGARRRESHLNTIFVGRASDLEGMCFPQDA